ncbi:hypothetical protein [Marivita sp.]|uniref:hypothetical protein n=1 Tax=Marivita sp. TaxID=2003365 RepID=UPI0025BEAEDF|nr:hypothetical protein [Marivita sp.]
MKPDFALTLSFNGISLMRRVPGGWTPVGDVALDATDLRGALADLRSEADALSAHGGQVKLVIPNEQIKYLTIPDTGQFGGALQDDIREALDGATPYAVDDLVFDWAQKDGTVYVAAVANETLDEAEAFAKSHHFEPVSFVARAADGQFEGEVFFGPATTWTGEAPSKDPEAMVIVPSDAVASLPRDGTLEDRVSEIEPPKSGSEPDAEDDAAEPVADTDAADAIDALAPGMAQDGGPTDPAQVAAAAQADSPMPVLKMEAPKTPDTPAFSSIRASRTAPDPGEAPSAPKVQAAPTEPASAPRFKLGGARKSTRDTDITAPALQVDAMDKSEQRSGFGFFSRRKPSTPAESAPPTKQVPPLTTAGAPADAPEAEATPRHDPEPARAAVARIAAMRAGRSTDGAATAPQTTVANERERMTIFGARTEPQIGGKPRYLGLMLTSALLILLLAVAAWASVFLDEGISRLFDGKDDTPSIARLPDVELQPLDGSITEPPEEEDLQFASLDADDAPGRSEDGISDLLPPPAALTPEEADARYAATGIWQRAPESPATPTLTTLDDLYVASIDGSVEQYDAFALPGAEALRNDRTYLSQPNPAAPGTRFTLDDRGLVIATPEGTTNPDGVRVFAGLPPVVPPARPAPPAAEPEAEAGTEPTDATAAVPALQGFRPRPRPEGLIEGNERAQLAGRTRAELAALRPAARPETLKAEEETAKPEATEFAVAQSVAPVTRPRNFGQIVERARETVQEQEQVTQVASVAPRTVQPSIPSTASVARQATLSNAINLRRINLIGVYGKPSSRRALVRLSNGRYQKVQVGDRLDGGRVAAIGESQLRYSKNGRNVVLDMPDG